MAGQQATSKSNTTAATGITCPRDPVRPITFITIASFTGWSCAKPRRCFSEHLAVSAALQELHGCVEYALCTTMPTACCGSTWRNKRIQSSHTVPNCSVRTMVAHRAASADGCAAKFCSGLVGTQTLLCSASKSGAADPIDRAFLSRQEFRMQTVLPFPTN